MSEEAKKKKGIMGLMVSMGIEKKPKHGGDDSEKDTSEDDASEDEESEESDDHAAAGRALKKALDSGDGGKIAEAFSNLLTICQDEDY